MLQAFKVGGGAEAYARASEEIGWSVENLGGCFNSGGTSRQSFSYIFPRDQYPRGQVGGAVEVWLAPRTCRTWQCNEQVIVMDGTCLYPGDAEALV